MPELPDIVTYVEALDRYIVGHELRGVRLASPFLLRSVEPPLTEIEGRRVTSVGRVGKRLVIGLGNELYLVLHLMIAGRIRWKPKDAKVPGKVGLAAFDFDHGTLMLTEAGSRKRAALHLVSGRESLDQFDRGGLDVFAVDETGFGERLRRENRTIKRALTDPSILDGIGNAYSDEILLRARMSPVKRTQSLDDDDMATLYRACREVLSEWIDRLREEVGTGFPDKVTAFRPEMAAHGKFGQPCPVCQAPIQRIRYADRETNYCARCQTGGKLLADRAMSRLLKGDWPKRLEDLE